ncbi:MAG TPA: hypothetical protein VF533_05415 [Solirubrobacteraceae bacterium]|jgi:hypothetical protein
MLNDPEVRDQVVAGACTRYGYTADQVEMRLYVGRFAGPTKGVHERGVRDWAAKTALVALKVLEAAGHLRDP